MQLDYVAVARNVTRDQLVRRFSRYWFGLPWARVSIASVLNNRVTMHTTSNRQREPQLPEGRLDQSTLLSLEEYHLLVKRLAEQIEALETSRASMQAERDSACRKLKIQHRLIEHLRARLEVVTGLDIHSVDAQGPLPTQSRRKATRTLSLGRAVQRFRADRGEPAVEAEPQGEIPAIDPAEFLPIDDRTGESVWLRGLREAGNRCRGVASACTHSLEHYLQGQGSRART